MSSPRSSSDRRNGVSTTSFSVFVSTNPRNRFSPVARTPMATTRVDVANVFPSRNTATRSSCRRSRSWNAFSFAALAVTKTRGDRRTRQPDRSRDRLGRRLIVATRDPVQDSSQQAFVDLAAAPMERRVGPQRPLATRTPHPRHPDRDALPRQPTRPRVAPVAHPQAAVLPGIARPGQGLDLLIEEERHVHQA